MRTKMRTIMRKNLIEKMMIMLKTRRTLVEIMKMMSSIWIIMWFNHLNFLIDFMIEFLIEFPYMIDFSFIKTAANFLLFMGFSFKLTNESDSFRGYLILI